MKYDINEIVSNEGQIIGRGKRDYLLFNYRVVGKRVYISFVRNLGSKEPDQDLVFFENLTKDWHTFINVQSQIYRILHDRSITNMFTFGKYKGQRYDEVTDLNYWCWLANMNRFEMESLHIEDFDILHKIAERRVVELGGELVGDVWMIPGSELFNATKEFEQVLNNNDVFDYVSENNVGRGHVGRWMIRLDEDLTNDRRTFYGPICGLKMENGGTKRAKGYVLCTGDYTVDRERLIVTVHSYNIIGCKLNCRFN